MNKTAIKNFAIWARVQLIESAKQRAFEYEITENGENKTDLATIGGRLLSKTEKEQRVQLIGQIRQKGYAQVMEEAAYTWFNRFIALRFMEVNGYLPSKVRVFTDDSGAFKPEILKEAMTIDLLGVDRQLVLELLDKQDNEALYKHLLIAQCNALNAPLPYMFERISNWTELLFPANLLRPDSVIGTMISSIPEEDWTDAVQIIGWLYQYYNSELKDETFALLKKNVKIAKERIPAATQLFTPDWIVRYMVENSLGRLWYEGHKDFDKTGWKYYLDEAEQEPEVEQQLAVIRADYTKIKPEEIKVIDPCMGSGHILVYAFDVLMQIYTAAGWTERDAVKSILLNNLYGLDIDDRAGQLAYFAVMMKAQQYDHRWLSRQARNPIQLSVFALQNSGDWMTFEQQMRRAFRNHSSLYEDVAVQTAEVLFTAFSDAKEFGSIIQPKVKLEELNLLGNVLDDMMNQIDLMDLVGQADVISMVETLLPMIRQARVLVQKYHVVVTNPPYMGSNGMTSKLATFAKRNYPNTKSDLFAIFMDRCKGMTLENWLLAMITQHAWMFLSSLEKLRETVCKEQIVCLAHLGIGAFEDLNSKVVQSVAFIVRKASGLKYVGIYDRLFEKQGLQESIDQKQEWLLNGTHRFIRNQSDFERIPGSPVAYWVDEHIFDAFRFGINITEFINTFQGIITGDNDKFLRLWFEPSIEHIAFDRSDMSEINLNHEYWIPYNKGGDFRNWYGNQEYVVYWKNGPDDKTRGKKSFSEFYLKEYVSWSYITSSTLATRFFPRGFLWDVSGSGIFDKSNMLLYLQCFIGSKVGIEFLKIINPTINYQVENIAQLPILIGYKDRIEELARQNISISKADWDAFEHSWGFVKHPLLPSAYGKNILISTLFDNWERECDHRAETVKRNEEEINQLFIEIYHLQETVSPKVDWKDITIRRGDKNREIKSLLSYAVGCMLGRYSLDVPGLAFAGGEWHASKYTTFVPDSDGIIPICDDEYFEEDIVRRLIEFLEIVYGKDVLEENLRYIANSLGGIGTAREIIRNYFVNGFFEDHCNTYSVSGSGKRPIYWLFDSGKKNGFKCLIYIHRYKPDTVARIRTDYVHELQSRYRTAIGELEKRIDTATTSERVRLSKQLETLQGQAEETRIFEEKVHHLADQMILLDLDDGVRANYSKFIEVLAKI